ncbi:O-linked N-acetylglucosamine transferase [Toxoplasma gondii RUB]|uniref:Probable UDP-N-acetylglucosamine--peptide N-acetylglucosaminyltransferase SPINDLY n=9 Tax=Toxoplasma gondii TaxID=5811 RepID=S7WCF1_TOXGG|nr:O-linked N-acetylglucosamine transferase [Toxoplasma gondii GT1]KAF4642040.1 O-linked N-acetylglucosamine transferase [Toxoplasma gondii]KFG49078.1 O-linked N-acetylglucosamine transferase [Toxoplasma gondii GAB2-2007-GAL-DOM2]KFG64025.1 O-linked N-acetylglucosamine transferase [Toxoplasma gondii RUB]
MNGPDPSRPCLTPESPPHSRGRSCPPSDQLGNSSSSSATTPATDLDSAVQDNIFAQAPSETSSRPLPIPAANALRHLPSPPLAREACDGGARPSPQRNCCDGRPAACNHRAVSDVCASLPEKSFARHFLTSSGTFPSAAEILKKAAFFNSGNRPHDALLLCNAGLEVYAEDADLWNCKGVTLRALGRLQEALDCCREALRLDPGNTNALNNIGVALKERGELLQAVEHYRASLVANPHQPTCRTNLAVALTDLGTKLKQEKKLQAALVCYTEALTADPTYAPCYYNLGVIHAETDDPHTALQMYREATRLNPSYVEAYNNMGAVCKNLGKLEDAISFYEKALACNANYQMSLSNMAVALTDLGTQQKASEGAKKAISLYKKALIYNPYYSDAYYNLGVAYADLHKFDKALVNYQLAVAFNPRCAEAYNNMGVIHKDRENTDQATVYYNKALEINPDFSQTLNNLGVLYTCTGKIGEALHFAKRAIEVNPNYAEAYNNLGVLYRDQGDIEDSVKAYDKCLLLDPNSPNAFHNKLLALNYLENLPENEICRVSEKWGLHFLSSRSPYTSWLCPPVTISPALPSSAVRSPARPSSSSASSSPASPGDSSASRVIRVGYIGPDFFTHSVSYFIHAPLVYHDKAKFHITVYANVIREDEKTQMFKTLPHRWRSIVGLNEQEVARIIREEDRIDILVELAGHTAHNRLDVMACKPAPVQISWIGYPNTTGLKTIDFRITDAVADPLTTTERYVEELVRMPNCFLCYQPPPDFPKHVPAKPPPVLDHGVVTFGSFNNLAKLGNQVIEIWSRILNAVPNSRLLVKARPFANKEMQRKFKAKFEAHGISGDRIDAMALIPACMDHLMVYSLVDIALDSFPYAGTTTTCEALVMGVPVVSLRRPNIHAHNVGATLLVNYGLPELIADDPEQYVRVAVELAGDVERLKRYRQSIRESVLEKASEPHAKQFTRDLEELYRQLLARKHRQK